VFIKLNYWNKRFWQSLVGITRRSTSQEIEDGMIKLNKYTRRFWCIWGSIILVLTIVGVEEIISYNDLSPQNDLSQPGQMIPFILGIITLIEGLASSCKPEPPPHPAMAHTDPSVSDGVPASPVFQEEGKGSEV
jgi:hypothetical protein